MKTNKAILKEICNAYSHDLTYTEAKEALLELDDISSSNQYIEIDGNEYRIIHEDDIWEIYVEEIEEVTKECYLGDSEIPSWLEIDWEETAKNTIVDGYGHHFASYDGEENEAAGHYIFRVN